MYAFQIKDTPQHAPLQYEVPAPRPEERMPAYSEDLVTQLERMGNVELAGKVRKHANRYFRLNFHEGGRICAYPLSCGNSLEPWCRWQKLKRRRESLLKVEILGSLGYTFEALSPLSDDAVGLIKKAVRKKIYPHRGVGVIDFVPVEFNKWRMVLVTTGLSGDAIAELMSGLQSLSVGLGLISGRSFPLDELGEELDRVMPRLRDFEGRSEMLRDYLGINFGKTTMTPKSPKSKLPPLDIGAGGLHCEPEEAAEMFEARLKGKFEPSVGIPPTEEASFMNFDNAERPTPSQYPADTLEQQGRIYPISTGEPSTGLGVPTGDAQDTVPPKTTSVSYRSENAIYTGRPCHMCRMPIKSSAEYQLVGKVFENFTGNCPDEIPARDVFEPSGELRERLRYG